MIHRVLAALLLAAATHALHSRELRGVVLDSASRRPLAGAVLVVIASSGTTLTRTIVTASGITGAEGTFGFCDRPSPERVLDLRARENTQYS